MEKNMSACLLALIAVALSFPMVAAAQHPHWEYEGEHGPTHWGSLDPAFHACDAGKHQSPIPINDPTSKDLPAIEFSYQATPLKIIDNGHTIQVTYAPGSFITVNHHKYELQQFHFHHPSEEEVNGRSYPVVAHLVHKDSTGKLAVVAVLLDEGKANEVIQAIWTHLPEEQGKEVERVGLTVDATKLLPARGGYYTFTGSLTTPPCTEGVTWFVLKTPSQISGDEIAVFAKHYPHNARPLQAVNRRTIVMSH
ncbi:MAG: carbonate dehydratase [Gemmatimonadetes bacterium]|nr:MAG: carbonate dehydratase [Gemmatimonadota bacterium]